MAKFIKSIFQSPSPEKIMNLHGEADGEGDSPIADKRKLSMSRSGRLKHAYKKRHSLSMELYGSENDIQPAENPKSMEYHVNTKGPPKPQKEKAKSSKSVDSSSANAMHNGNKSPEEEIDSAFEIIDKS